MRLPIEAAMSRSRMIATFAPVFTINFVYYSIKKLRSRSSSAAREQQRREAEEAKEAKTHRCNGARCERRTRCANHSP